MERGGREERRGEEGEGKGLHGKGGARERELSTVPSFSSKDTNSIKLGCHTLVSSMKALSPNAITLETGTSTYGFGGT